MPKYVKRPSVIDAFCTRDFVFPSWFFDAEKNGIIKMCYKGVDEPSVGDPYCVIETYNGPILTMYGDYIFKDSTQNISSLKAEDFILIYEKLEK